MAEKDRIEGRCARKTLIQSVERALDILEIIGRADGPVKNCEIAARLGISPTTANNLIRTLYSRCYLDQHRGGRYSLGLQSFILGSSADIWRDLRLASLEPMRRLNIESDATCFLGVLYQYQLIAINRITSRSPISISIRQTWLDRYHSTATGKVLLSVLPETELDSFLKKHPLRRLTEKTICDPEELKADLAGIRRLGYAVTRDESGFGVSALGVPISGRDGRVIAALGITFSSYFFNDDYLQSQLVPLEKARAAIETKLRG
ncbi:MAG: IclR family transcriptional regulator [Lentisphaeria bacterium]|nr:IclR family transcriptional regulator [Lentisphaeria bacterium]MBQ7206741.1 IclR family transcriptional regulator [Lentisphaeria bacterium]